MLLLFFKFQYTESCMDITCLCIQLPKHHSCDRFQENIRQEWVINSIYHLHPRTCLRANVYRNSVVLIHSNRTFISNIPLSRRQNAKRVIGGAKRSADAVPTLMNASPTSITYHQYNHITTSNNTIHCLFVLYFNEKECLNWVIR